MKPTSETKTSHHWRNFLLLSMSFFVVYTGVGTAQTDSGATKPGSQTTTSERNGQHDFDFALGSWKAHLKRLEHPLSGSNTWIEFDGTFVARKVWDGRAMMEEVELDAPGGSHRGTNSAPVQRANAPVEHLLGQQQKRRYGYQSSSRSIQERTRRVLWHGQIERQAHLRPLCLD